MDSDPEFMRDKSTLMSEIHILTIPRNATKNPKETPPDSPAVRSEYASP